MSEGEGERGSAAKLWRGSEKNGVTKRQTESGCSNSLLFGVQ